MKDYRMIIEWGADNCSAYSPDVPGCVTTGKTRAKTRANMLDALDFHIETLVEDGGPVPVPHGRATGTLSSAAQRRLDWLRARRAKLASMSSGRAKGATERPNGRPSVAKVSQNGARAHRASR